MITHNTVQACPPNFERREFDTGPGALRRFVKQAGYNAMANTIFDDEYNQHFENAYKAGQAGAGVLIFSTDKVLLYGQGFLENVCGLPSRAELFVLIDIPADKWSASEWPQKFAEIERRSDLPTLWEWLDDKDYYVAIHDEYDA